MEICDRHIGIPDGLNFEHVIFFTQHVEDSVQPVKHIHHQMRLHTTSVCGLKLLVHEALSY